MKLSQILDIWNLKIAERAEAEPRAREIQILVNIIEPDPRFQPFYLSDKATVFEVSMADTAVIQGRLEFYFRRPLPVPLATPLWQLVDALKETFPGWPDEWAPEDN